MDCRPRVAITVRIRSLFNQTIKLLRRLGDPTPSFRPTTGTGEAMDSVTHPVPYVTLAISEIGVLNVSG